MSYVTYKILRERKRGDVPDKPSPPPPPPPGPPCRTYIDIPFVGMVETKESKMGLIRYRAFMEGYQFGRRQK